ncbi:hypothetical protein ACU4GR_00380 [Methylobacterium oryzae CBMB20]
MADAATLRLAVSQTAGGARHGRCRRAGARGSIEAGRRIAEICLGGLGTGDHRAERGRSRPGRTR